MWSAGKKISFGDKLRKFANWNTYSKPPPWMKIESSYTSIISNQQFATKYLVNQTQHQREPIEVIPNQQHNLSNPNNVGAEEIHHENTSHSHSDNLAWSFSKLKTTSRSFAIVTNELPNELKVAVALFYLVLRALDSIEDNMKLNKTDKKTQLLAFYTHLRDQNWNLHGYGETLEEAELLENFHRIVDCLLCLRPTYQSVIRDICQRMGDGMAQFTGLTINTISDWELYCYYVAGLVGEGLSGMWVSSGLEKSSLISKDFIPKSISMGLFLQKTNIIRDVREDYFQGRYFWPQEIWGQYVRSQGQLFEQGEGPGPREVALHCLNHIVTDALKHAEDCLNYMSQLQDPTIFRFCSIPQVMAISTLALCYNNYNVMLQNVKIPKTKALGIMLSMRSLKNVQKAFSQYAQVILKKISKEDPNADLTAQRAQRIIELCK